MRMNGGAFFGIFVCFCLTINGFCQTDPKPWEKFGLSQTEWKIIEEKNIPLDKVRELLRVGISISEYVDKTWEKLNLTEKAWIEKRRSGLTNYDIEVEQQMKQLEWKGDVGGTMKAELGSFSSNKDLLLSFVVPGLQQNRLKQKVRGRIMSGLAIGSLAACLVASLDEGTFEGIPLYFVLVPDMFWSMIDYKITASKMGDE